MVKCFQQISADHKCIALRRVYGLLIQLLFQFFFIHHVRHATDRKQTTNDKRNETNEQRPKTKRSKATNKTHCRRRQVNQSSQSYGTAYYKTAWCRSNISNKTRRKRLLYLINGPWQKTFCLLNKNDPMKTGRRGNDDVRSNAMSRREAREKKIVVVKT